MHISTTWVHHLWIKFCKNVPQHNSTTFCVFLVAKLIRPLFQIYYNLKIHTTYTTKNIQQQWRHTWSRKLRVPNGHHFQGAKPWRFANFQGATAIITRFCCCCQVAVNPQGNPFFQVWFLRWELFGQSLPTFHLLQKRVACRFVVAVLWTENKVESYPHQTMSTANLPLHLSVLRWSESADLRRHKTYWS